MKKKGIVTTSVLGLFSSVFAFLGIVSCCGFPLIAGALALFGVGAAQLQFFAAYRAVFIGLAFVSLAYGFYQLYLKKAPVDDCAADDEQSCCKPPSKKRNRFAKSMLWLGLIAVSLSLLLSLDTGTNSLTSTPVESVMQGGEGEPKTSCCPSEQNPSVRKKQKVSCSTVSDCEDGEPEVQQNTTTCCSKPE